MFFISRRKFSRLGLKVVLSVLALSAMSTSQAFAAGKTMKEPYGLVLESIGKPSFARSLSTEERKTIAIEVQKEVYDQVLYVPLGQDRVAAAWRKSLTGVLEGPATPVFWNIDKSE